MIATNLFSFSALADSSEWFQADSKYFSQSHYDDKNGDKLLFNFNTPETSPINTIAYVKNPNNQPAILNGFFQFNLGYNNLPASTTIKLESSALVVNYSGDSVTSPFYMYTPPTNTQKISIQFEGSTDSSLTLNLKGNPNGLKGFIIKNNQEINLNSIGTLIINDSKIGIENSSKLDNNSKFQYFGGKNFLIQNGNDSNLLRGILSAGEASTVIQTTESIKIHTNQGWLDSQKKNDVWGAGLITGNGSISLSSTNISLLGKSNTNDKNYSASYSIAATAKIVWADKCTSCYVSPYNSDINIESTNFDLSTNWGAIYSSSTDKFYSKVNIISDLIKIVGAGASSDKDDLYKNVGDEHAAIRAVSGGAEAYINIEGNQVQIDYSSEDLNKKETEHDLLYANGENASITINGQDLSLNQYKDGNSTKSNADIRNIAFADKNGTININTDKGKSGTAIVTGNLTARQTGKINFTLNAGSNYEGAAFDNSYYYYDSTNNEIDQYGDRGAITLTGDGGSKWIVKNYENRGIQFVQNKNIFSTINELAINDTSTKANPFTVDLTQENDVQRLNITNLSGNGSAQFKTRFIAGSAADLSNDKVFVHNAQGSHGIYVDYDGPHDIAPAVTLKENYLVSDNSQQGNFYLANPGESVDIGLYRYTLTNDVVNSHIGGDSQAKDWYLTRSDDLTPGADTQISFAGSQRFLHWADLQDLRKRLGEVRYGAQDGAWARVIAQNDKTDANGGAGGLKQDYYGVNVGFDKIIKADEKNMWLVGGSFVAGDAEQKARGNVYGKGETDRYGINLYATYAMDNGFYADFIVSGDKFDQDVTTRTNDKEQKADYDTWGAGVSAEIGKMFSFNSKSDTWGPWYNHMWIEPQLQLSYYYLDGSDYQLSDRGIKVNLDDDSSLIGRAGIVVGKKWNFGPDYEKIDKRYFQMWLKAGVKHDFLGDYDLSLNDTTFSNNIGQTTLYYGLGADLQLSDRVRLYLNAEREEGDEYSKEYEASLGIKVNFD